jgi:hypothetical protein
VDAEVAVEQHPRPVGHPAAAAVPRAGAAWTPGATSTDRPVEPAASRTSSRTRIENASSP